MSSEEKFKENLRGVVESKTFRFTEDDWKAAEAVIERERRINGRGVTYLSAFLFMVSALALMSSITPQNTNGITGETVLAAGLPARVVFVSVREKEVVYVPQPVVRYAASPIAFNPRTESRRTTANYETAPVRSEEIPQNENPSVATPEQNEPPASMPPEITSAPEIKQSQPAPSGVPEKITEKVTPVENEAVTMLETVSPGTNPALAKTENSVTATTPAVTVKTVAPRQLPLEIEAGAMVHPGWTYNGTRDGSGISPVFGIRYLSDITEKLWLSVGLFYQETGRLAYSAMTSKTVRLGLGEESQVTVISPKKAYYLGIPLRVRFELDDRHSIGAGYSLNYLLNVDANVTKYRETNGVQSEFREYESGGYTEGFATTGSQLSVFYRYRLTKRLYAGSELLFGLSDIKNDGFFGINARERNSGLRLTLTYSLTRREERKPE